MDALFKFLVPLVFVAIWIITAIIRAREAMRKREGGTAESPWKQIADSEEIRRFLQGAMGAKPTQPSQPPRPAPRPSPTARRQGLPGMPAGGVTPSARRGVRPTQPSREERARRAARSVHPSPPPFAPPAPSPKRPMTPHVKDEEKPLEVHQFRGEKRRFQARLEKRMKEAAARLQHVAVTPEVATPPVAPAAPVSPGTGATVAESAALIPASLTRADLARAIVMAEVLGPPLAARGEAGGIQALV